MASIILICIIVFFLAGHALLIETYRRWFLKMQVYKPNKSPGPPVFFSVVIPARNEEEQIGECLRSVLEQLYPAAFFEVIVADDCSTDRTADRVRELQSQYANLRLLDIKALLQGQELNSYKKKAIELAIQAAEGDWIVTTDADCIVSRQWLQNLSDFINEKHPVFVAAPVSINNNGSFVSLFQSLDFMSLQGVTAASVSAGFHTMCNGANLAYSKEAFYSVGGFSGIDNIASGDDMLLMHKIYARYKQQVQYLFTSSSIVITTPMKSWRSFLNQRIRWASKADKYDDKRIVVVLAFIYTLNLLFILLPVAAIWIDHVGWYWLSMLVIKTIIDFRFMIPVSRFFSEEKLLPWFPLMQPFHIAYTVIAGWLGKFGKYSWKGRTVK